MFIQKDTKQNRTLDGCYISLDFDTKRRIITAIHVPPQFKQGDSYHDNVLFFNDCVPYHSLLYFFITFVVFVDQISIRNALACDSALLQNFQAHV